VAPFIGVNNMFNASYNAKARLNQDAHARFFAPAPRNACGGFSMRHPY